MTEISLTWTNGQSLSNEFVDLSGLERAIAIMCPASFSNNTLTIVAYDSAGNAYYLTALDQAEFALTIDTTNAGVYPLDPVIFAGIAKFKVRRGTLASPYTTGAETAKIVRRVY